MLEILTSEEMNRADRLAAEQGVSGLWLMEQAGVGAAHYIKRLYPQRPKTLILCGPGNNGGDGYVIARHLRRQGWSVTIASAQSPDQLRGDAKINALQWRGRTIDLQGCQPPNYGLVIDALFGAGLSRSLSGDYKAALVEAEATPLIAIDMPSGVNGSTGAVMGYAPEAVATITFCRKKPAHLLARAKPFCGAVHLVPIDIPDEVLADINPTIFENGPALWADHLPRLKPDSHKYSRGMGVIVSGPLAQTGAARLAARACLKSGAGLVKIACPASATFVLAGHETEVMIVPITEARQFDQLVNDSRLGALCIGPGLGQGDWPHQILEAALGRTCPIVIDADAIRLLAMAAPLRAKLSLQHILTPHEGEFEALMPGLLADSENRLEAARHGAKVLGAIMVLKGPDTIIAHPDGHAIINQSGTPWLATAGSGDVLAGAITGLLAQGMEPFEAAAAGVFLHGKAAEGAGPYLIASDLILNLPRGLQGIIGQ